MLTVNIAKEISGIEDVRFSNYLLKTLFKCQKWRNNLFCEVNDNFPDQPLTQQHLFLADIAKRLPGLRFSKLHFLTWSLRIKKKPEEIELLSKSIAIIKDALNKVAKKIKPGIMEYQIEAELLFNYRNTGCRRLGYDIIAASGQNATILHYSDNQAELQKDDLVLIDTGVEYNMYSGDITRVFPINGTFNERQRKCYQTVLEVNKTVIDQLRPGQTFREINQLSDKIIGEIYHKNGFIDKPEIHSSISLHRIGHYLGLDVHDTGKLDSPVEPGTVITVEPGMYLKDEKIGIRIEDNILFTQSGVEVLSKEIPKEIKEIEQEMCS